MDVVTGLSAIGQAVGLVKELRDLGRAVDEATFKLKIADIQIALAEAKIALSDAKVEISDLKSQIVTLTTGDLCPVCRQGRLKVLSVNNDTFAAQLEFHTVKCNLESCSYSATRIYNTNIGIYTSKTDR